MDRANRRRGNAGVATIVALTVALVVAGLVGGSAAAQPAKSETSLALTAMPSLAYKGDVLQAAATVVGGPNATGEVTFKLYPPSDTLCAGRPAHVEKVAVVGGQAATTTGFVVPVKNRIGTWRWLAWYGGDELHKSSKAGCGSAVVVVTKRGDEPVQVDV